MLLLLNLKVDEVRHFSEPQGRAKFARVKMSEFDETGPCIRTILCQNATLMQETAVEEVKKLLAKQLRLDEGSFARRGRSRQTKENYKNGGEQALSSRTYAARSSQSNTASDS